MLRPHPATLTKVNLAASDDAKLRCVTADVTTTFCGFHRSIQRGMVWQAVGTIEQGTVHRPIGSSMTVLLPSDPTRGIAAGAGGYEVYVVESKGELVGFYLPTEGAFTPLDSPSVISWEERK